MEKAVNLHTHTKVSKSGAAARRKSQRPKVWDGGTRPRQEDGWLLPWRCRWLLVRPDRGHVDAGQRQKLKREGRSSEGEPDSAMY